MSGNANEWVDGCDVRAGDGSQDQCAVPGQTTDRGSLKDEDFSCAGSFYAESRAQREQALSFRCCADLK
jgi:hypothetical protein